MSSLSDMLDTDDFVTLSGSGSSLLHLPPPANTQAAER